MTLHNYNNCAETKLGGEDVSASVTGCHCLSSRRLVPQLWVPLLVLSVVSGMWHHVMCVLNNWIRVSHKLAAYNQPRNEANCQYELVNVTKVC